jgi:hypothetical protein
LKTTSNIENKICRVIIRDGSPDLTTAKNFSKEMFENCLMSSCNKILVIDQLSALYLSDDELVQLAEYNAHVMPSIIRMAVLCKEEHLEKIKIWESAAVSRGANVKIFVDNQIAENWLKQTE